MIKWLARKVLRKELAELATFIHGVCVDNLKQMDALVKEAEALKAKLDSIKAVNVKKEQSGEAEKES